MDQARDEIRKTKTAVLVEGYFDCIGLHQAGVKHAVALCSTALTPGTWRCSRRAEAKELVLLLDGDEAGRKAVERLAGPLLAAGRRRPGGAAARGRRPGHLRPARWAPTGVQQLLGEAPAPHRSTSSRPCCPQGADASFEEKMAALERLKPIAAAAAGGAGALGLLRRPVAALRAARGRAGDARCGARPPPRSSRCPSPAAPARRAPAGRRTAARERSRPTPLEACFVAAVLREPAAAGHGHLPGQRRAVAPRAAVWCSPHVASGHGPEDALYRGVRAPSKRALEAAARAARRATRRAGTGLPGGLSKAQAAAHRRAAGLHRAGHQPDPGRHRADGGDPAAPDRAHRAARLEESSARGDCRPGAGNKGPAATGLRSRL